MSDIVERYERNGFTVTISYDPECPSPRDDDCPGARLVLFHSQYTFPNDAGLDTDDYEGWADMAAHLRSDHGALFVMAVYMIDHSGLAFRVADLDAGNPFADPWDSGQLGFSYVTAKIWKDTQGTDWDGSDEQLAMARKLIANDVEQYGMYVNGECYSYTITDKHGDQVDDGCNNGIIGFEWVTEEANMDADHTDHTEHAVKCNGRLDRAAGTIVHGGPCPLHR
jgi:hypothetical protein